MLPGEALWNGGAQFWLFRRVFCTKESLEAEIRASDVVGFATGKIWQELQERGFLQTFDWKDFKKEAPAHYKRLIDIHRILRKKYDEEAILNLLCEGNSTELENIKLDLLGPVLDLKSCVQNISPNSIRYWFNEGEIDKTKQQTSAALERLAKPIIEQKKSLKVGLRLCDPPGTNVEEKHRLRQKEVEEKLEKPQIPNLFAGIMPLPEYWNLMALHKSVYEPINRQLWTNWEKNRDKLERLRDLADRYLWEDLHKDWLPRLNDEPSFYREFTTLLRDALIQARMDPYLDWATNLAIVGVSALSVFAETGLSQILGAPQELTGIGMGSTIGYLLHNIHKSIKEKTENITVFYQQALK